MNKETKQNIGEFDLIHPSKELLDAVIIQADALKKEAMTPERFKNMSLVSKYLNAYIKAFVAKTSYFKMTEVPKKVDQVKKYYKAK